ncbi:deoxyribonuclease IV [Eggerthellaceae bacterium zg-997]|nr:deoxyribonuclease IV [Eggerthellaceae bacterium zg-997]
MLTLGCHLSIAKGFAAAARDARRIDANTFQFFTRNPRGGRARELDPRDLQRFRQECVEGGIERMLAHAPYTLNPASSNPDTRAFARQTLGADLARMEEFPHQLYNMHPGAHTGQGVECGVQLIAEALNEVMRPEHTTTVLLETMAGKGSEVGGRFEELAAIIDRVDLGDRMGVCLDTCHVWDAGYDVANRLDAVLEEFDCTVGLGRLRALHLNDSQNPCGAHKDRHARLGEGHIGFDAFAAIVNHPALRDLPMYLETPQDSLDGYATEIARLREVAARA